MNDPFKVAQYIEPLDDLIHATQRMVLQIEALGTDYPHYELVAEAIAELRCAEVALITAQMDLVEFLDPLHHEKAAQAILGAIENLERQ